MDEGRAKQLVGALVVGAEALAKIAEAAVRQRQGLSGTSRYAISFHEEVIKLSKVENAIIPILRTLPNFYPEQLTILLAAAKSTTTKLASRNTAARQIRIICEVEIEPQLSDLSAPLQPKSEPVLAAAVLAKAPSYLQRTLLQANGCYEQRWYEAASVMIRKLVENLIIDVYEQHRKAEEIKNKDGDYLMLSGLVNAVLGQTYWSLQRETKKSLPEIKQLGDRGAHNRRYEANRQDIDKTLPGLRATVDDLAHLAGHK